MESKHTTIQGQANAPGVNGKANGSAAPAVAPARPEALAGVRLAPVNGNQTPGQPPFAVPPPAGFRAKSIASSPEVAPRPAHLIDRELAAMAAGASGREFTEKVYARAREILQDAYESAAELRIEALSRVREQLDRVTRTETDTRSRLDEEADALKAQATLESKLALQRAQREADAVVARARALAEQTVKSANEQAAAVRAEAKREAQGVVEDARRITQEARNRIHEVERLEEQFEKVALEFTRWLGASVDTKQSRLARIRAASVLKA